MIIQTTSLHRSGRREVHWEALASPLALVCLSTGQHSTPPLRATEFRFILTPKELDQVVKRGKPFPVDLIPLVLVDHGEGNLLPLEAEFEPGEPVAATTNRVHECVLTPPSPSKARPSPALVIPPTPQTPKVQDLWSFAQDYDCTDCQVQTAISRFYHMPVDISDVQRVAKNILPSEACCLWLIEESKTLTKAKLRSYAEEAKASS